MDAILSVSTFKAAASAGLAENGAGRWQRQCSWTRFAVGRVNEHSLALRLRSSPGFMGGETRILMPDRYRAVSATRSSERGASLVVRAFTEKQEALVKGSWEILRKDAGKHAVDFFLRVFEIAPSTKRLFSFLRDSDVPLEKNPKLKSHALKVFVITCEAAMSLRNKGAVSTPGSTLKNMADAHALSGVVDEHYDVVKYALMTTLEEGLPAEKWDPEVKQAWTEAYDELVKAIKAEAGTGVLVH